MSRHPKHDSPPTLQSAPPAEYTDERWTDWVRRQNHPDRRRANNAASTTMADALFAALGGASD